MSDEVAVNPAFEGLTPEEKGRKVCSMALYSAAGKRGISRDTLKEGFKHLFGEAVTSTRDLNYDQMKGLRNFLKLMPLVSALKEEARIAVQAEYDAKLLAEMEAYKKKLGKPKKKKVLKNRTYEPLGMSVYTRQKMADEKYAQRMAGKLQ